MKENINLGKLDDFSLIIRITTPLAYMATKRAGENFPHLSFIKSIPHVIFMPSTMIVALALVSAMLTNKMLQGSVRTS
jgi:hypothetical protein